MARRMLLSHDSPQVEDNDYRKKRTYMSAPSSTHATIMRAAAYKPTSGANLDKMQTSWIGKKLIFNDQLARRNINVVHEKDIALYASPYIYRILFVNDPKVTDIQNLMFYDDPTIKNDFRVRSVPTVDFKPARMNVLVDLNNIIQDIRYF